MEVENEPMCKCSFILNQDFLNVYPLIKLGESDVSEEDLLQFGYFRYNNVAYKWYGVFMHKVLLTSTQPLFFASTA